MSAAALVALQRHTWYLTEDCISIALFNPDLEDEEKNKLAQILESYQQHSWRSESQHYLQFLPALRSLILLENAPSSYSPSLRWTTNNSWKETDKYDAARKAISNLHPVNDSAERALSMATTFNGRITKDEDSYQNLLLVVEGHRKTYGFKSKADLKKFF